MRLPLDESLIVRVQRPAHPGGELPPRAHRAAAGEGRGAEGVFDAARPELGSGFRPSALAARARASAPRASLVAIAADSERTARRPPPPESVTVRVPRLRLDQVCGEDSARQRAALWSAGGNSKRAPPYEADMRAVSRSRASIRLSPGRPGAAMADTDHAQQRIVLGVAGLGIAALGLAVLASGAPSAGPWRTPTRPRPPWSTSALRPHATRTIRTSWSPTRAQ